MLQDTILCDGETFKSVRAVMKILSPNTANLIELIKDRISRKLDQQMSSDILDDIVEWNNEYYANLKTMLWLIIFAPKRYCSNDFKVATMHAVANEIGDDPNANKVLVEDTIEKYNDNFALRPTPKLGAIDQTSNEEVVSSQNIIADLLNENVSKLSKYATANASEENAIKFQKPRRKRKSSVSPKPAKKEKPTAQSDAIEKRSVNRSLSIKEEVPVEVNNSPKKSGTKKPGTPKKVIKRQYYEKQFPCKAVKKRPYKVISLFNIKGGVAKSTLTLNLAHQVAKTNKRVLIVDADAQCNTTAFFALSDSGTTVDELFVEEMETDGNNILDQPKDEKPANFNLDELNNNSLSKIILKIAKGNPHVNLKDICIYQVTEPLIPLFLFPGSVTLNSVEKDTSFNFHTRSNSTSCGCFKLFFATLAEQFDLDYIFVDVGPSAGILNELIMFSVDLILPVVFPDMHSFHSLSSLINLILPEWKIDFLDYQDKIAKSDEDLVFTGFPVIGPVLCSNYKVRAKSANHIPYNGKLLTTNHSKIAKAFELFMQDAIRQGKIQFYPTEVCQPILYCCTNLGDTVLGKSSVDRILVVEQGDSGKGVRNRLDQVWKYVELILNRL